MSLDPNRDVDGLFITSIVFIPSNVLTPLTCIYSIVVFFAVSNQKLLLCSKFLIATSALIVLLYVYDQMVVFSDPGGS